MAPFERLSAAGARFQYEDGESEVTLQVPIGAAIKSKDIAYSLKPTRLTLGIKGGETLVDEELGGVKSGAIESMGLRRDLDKYLF